MERLGRKIDSVLSAVVLIMMIVLMLFLTGSAFFETFEVTAENTAGELCRSVDDNFFLNLIVSAIVVIALYVFFLHLRTLTTKKLEIVLMIWTFVLGCAFIVSVKLSSGWYSDSFQLTNAALRASAGDMSALGDYFVRFPFQLGFVFYAEVFFRVFRLVAGGVPEGYMCLALQGVNVLWLMLGFHSIIRSSELLLRDEHIGRMTALLLIFCLPPVLSCTFLYGNIPAFGCAMAAVWMFAEFTQDKKLLYGILSGVFMALGLVLKLNTAIFAVALCGVWVIELMKHGSVKSLLCLIVSVVLILGLRTVPQRIYEARCDKSFGTGIPMISWMAMGFDDGHAGPGWYRSTHTVDTFASNGHDPEATAEVSRLFLKLRVTRFMKSPRAAWDFFSIKFRSQWNEPSYESLWVNEVQLSYGEKGGLYNIFCGDGIRRTLDYMNIYQQIIFLGMLIGLPILWRRRSVRKCTLLIIILGGMLYHLLFEAKSQYCLTYFMLMVPMAAAGYCKLFTGIERR